MNAIAIDRTKLKQAAAAAGERFPLRILGVLPPGSAPHVPEPVSLILLAEKGTGLTLFGVAGAEEMLSEELGVPVGIVLKSELRDPRDANLLKSYRPL